MRLRRNARRSRKSASRAFWTNAQLAQCVALLRLNAEAFRGLVAVALSNVWISGPSFFQCLDTLIECGLASLADLHPDRVSSAIFAGLRKLHPSKTVTSNAAPTSRRAIRPEYAPTVQTSRPFAFSAVRACRSRYQIKRARHRSGGPSLGSRFALRGLVFQSPNTIYQSDPFCPRFATIAPLRLSILVSSLRARRAVAPLYAETASGFGEAALSDLIGTGSYLPSIRRLLRRCRGGVGFAHHRPPTRPLRAGCPPQRIPRAEDGFYRFAAKGTSSANQKPHCIVASVPSRILRSRFAGCDPP